MQKLPSTSLFVWTDPHILESGRRSEYTIRRAHLQAKPLTVRSLTAYTGTGSTAGGSCLEDKPWQPVRGVYEWVCIFTQEHVWVVHPWLLSTLVACAHCVCAWVVVTRLHRYTPDWSNIGQAEWDSQTRIKDTERQKQAMKRLWIIGRQWMEVPEVQFWCATFANGLCRVTADLVSDKICNK